MVLSTSQMWFTWSVLSNGTHTFCQMGKDSLGQARKVLGACTASGPSPSLRIHPMSYGPNVSLPDNLEPRLQARDRVARAKFC